MQRSVVAFLLGMVVSGAFSTLPASASRQAPGRNVAPQPQSMRQPEWARPSGAPKQLRTFATVRGADDIRAWSI
ncbi:MAG: hypothetical protein P4L83_22205 [Nevskia sp.]|nr:hypothetical protein [Nevskia sp.]